LSQTVNQVNLNRRIAYKCVQCWLSSNIWFSIKLMPYGRRILADLLTQYVLLYTLSELARSATLIL
jgi:hypothetical protein